MIVVLLAALLFAGATVGSTDATRRGRTIRVVDSSYGTVVADRSGEALYLFDAERTAKPACYGDCAAAWPPVLAKGMPVAGRGLAARWLGTTRRRNGRVQVTYRGHPLYYYVHDTPGRILCHDVVEFGGTWLVVSPQGTART
jgi:predicted lipoprotein with Yx(FWY)xxD motif